MSTTETGSRTYAGEYQAVFDSVVRVAPTVNLKVTSADPATGLITMTSGFSFSSWGEKVSVNVGQVTEGSIQVDIQSKLKFGLVDWGKNKKNLNKLFFGVEQALATP